MEQLGPVARTCSRMVSRARMSGGNSDSKAAAMVMQGSTRGLIKGLQNLHQFPYQDTDVSTLAQRLLDLESESLGQMRAYL